MRFVLMHQLRHHYDIIPWLIIYPNLLCNVFRIHYLNTRHYHDYTMLTAKMMITLWHLLFLILILNVLQQIAKPRTRIARLAKRMTNASVMHAMPSFTSTPLLKSVKVSYATHTFVNSLRPKQNGRHFADDIFKCFFLNENAWISPKSSLKFVPKVRINNIPAWVQIMAWRRPGDKPLSEPMMVSLLTHICVTRPQWVNSPPARNGGKSADEQFKCNFVIEDCLIFLYHKWWQNSRR